MRWSEHQRAMLREMGVPPFWPAEPAPPEDVAGRAPDENAARSVQVASVEPSLAMQTRAMDSASSAAAVPGALTPPRVVAPTVVTPPAARVVVGTPAGMPAAETGLGPRPAGINTMDWATLREAVSGCQACGLCKSRTQAVFGVGNEQADWMIIGEAPGEQEDRQGEPFVGRAGQLLDRMLFALGLTRAQADAQQQVFIANVLKCRPPANRNPQPQEVAQCEPYLMRQLELVQPKVILAMGRFAVQSILKSTEPIGRLRGRVHELAGVPVVVTYHPAYLLRNPADKGLAWDDMCLAREVMQRARA